MNHVEKKISTPAIIIKQYEKESSNVAINSTSEEVTNKELDYRPVNNIKRKSVILKNVGSTVAIIANNISIPLNDLKLIKPHEDSNAKQKLGIRSIQVVKHMNSKDGNKVSNIVRLQKPHLKKVDTATNTSVEYVDTACQTDFINKYESAKTYQNQDCQTDYEKPILEANTVLTKTPSSLLLNPDLDLEFLESYLKDPSALSDNNLDFSPQYGGYNKIPLAMSESYIQNMRKYYINCDTLDADGYLPIHHSVEKHDLVDLKRQCIVLYGKNKNVDFVTNEMHTPLQLAILHKCSVEIVDVLLKCKSSLEPQDQDGNSVIHLATMNNDVDVLNKLLQFAKQSNYNINNFNFEGLTPLMVAILNEKLEDIQALLKYGADPNIQDQKSGRTSLFHAIEMNNVEIVNLLLLHEADTNVRNFFGMNCRDVVFELDTIHADIRKMILSKSEVKRYIKPAKPCINKRQRSKKKSPNDSEKKTKFR